MKQSQKSAKLLTIRAWSNAFFVFAAIYLKAHPTCTHDLLEYYGDTIRKAAARFEGGGSVGGENMIGSFACARNRVIGH